MAASVLASSVTLTGSLTAPASAAGTSPAVPAADAGVDEPLVIAHRGASGYRPEHTLAAYKLAIQMGADYVEPDLVSTKDGVLVARHENEISGTTDVADHPEFADRRTTKVVDGHEVTGWFTEDFTLAELKTLRAEERLPDVRPGNTRYDGRYQVPTFDEVLDLVARESRRRGEVVGVYPETKHPTYFDSVGLSLEEPLVEALQRHHLNRPNARVYIQSFETGNLRELADTVRVPLVQLVDAAGAPYDLQAAGDPRTYADLVTREGLREIATYADSVGANKDIVLPRDAEGYLTRPSSVVDDAHDAGLDVHVWTMRDENRFMARDFWIGSDPNAKGDAFAEYAAFFDAGVDGVFSDYSDTAVAAREAWFAEQRALAG
ncbi:glycerophosphodiester phosphodiesterase [Nocardioides sp. WL0053]|uniref:glycerophosphodiester phosphodiesterase n=1 Tax=Nocardioides jiangsuensis TaxID=2866161 RepID=A0ABS7RMR1_9ACTN|nr:glycerophosphodiester phosphodiesterase [Nocardioides jiangsuensis]MBY9076325.1 glycerophosphodiester phosphodiesterase [Nocardioides jiangsuensis]